MTDEKLSRRIEKLERLNRLLQSQITIDLFTGLLKKLEIEARISSEVGRANREKNVISVLFFDIDNFKGINTEFGQKGGDQIILRVADEIKRTFRGYDLLGRHGGEEFVVALPGTDIWKAYKVAEKLRKNIEKLEIKIGTRKVNLTVSVGVSTSEDIPIIENKEGDTAGVLLIKLANDAESLAKQNGKNQTCINLCGALLEEHNIERVKLEQDLIGIIEKARNGSIEKIECNGQPVPLQDLILNIQRVERGRAQQGEYYITTIGSPDAAYTGFVSGTYNGEQVKVRNVVQDIGMQIVEQVRELNLTKIPDPTVQLWQTGPGKLNFLNLLLTRSCNLNCVYCTQDHAQVKTLDKLIWERAIDEATEGGNRQGVIINFTGGEVLIPRIRDMTYRLIEYAKNQGAYVTMNTNATQIDRQVASELLGTGINALNISLDSHLPHLENEITRNKKAFARIMLGLRAILDLRTDSKLEKVNINHVITKMNYKGIAEFVGWMGKILENEGRLFDEINPLPIKEGGVALNLAMEDILFFNEYLVPRLEYLSGRYDLKLLGLKVSEIFGKNSGNKNEISERMYFATEGIYYGVADMFQLICASALTSATIDPEGNVFPCTYHREARSGDKIILGNITTTSIREMQEKYFETLSRVPKGCIICQRLCGPDLKRINRGVKKHLARSGVL
ncbi:MAG: diguanylate cyclase [Candidatus Micrarchaeia archaeon]